MDTFDIVTKLFAALLLGMSLGVERAIAGKSAGVRTHALVAMGSALFIITGLLALGQHSSLERTYIESIRIAVAIITGIGFLGAGLFLFKDSNAGGMTTAAGIWVASGVGIAVGYGLFTVAIISTIFTLLIFTLFWYLENKVKDFGYHLHKDRLIHKKGDGERESN
jgi:putative Mg2+ transporter-C (MgtC) family protein